MKKLLTLLLGFLLLTPVFSQKRDITLEDLWKNYSFYPKSYSGLNSMNDGEHYVKMEKTDDGQEIIKYKFKSGKKVRTLFKSTNFEIRFHFEPGVKITKTQEGKTILIELINSGWRFFCKYHSIGVETGLYFGKKNSFSENQNIFISGFTNNQEQEITWEIIKI